MCIRDRPWVAVDIAANNNGEIPVKEFLVHDVDPYDVLKAITHVLDLRLRLSSSNAFPIRVVERGDIPPQDDEDDEGSAGRDTEPPRH